MNVLHEFTKAKATPPTLFFDDLSPLRDFTDQ